MGEERFTNYDELKISNLDESERMSALKKARYDFMGGDFSAMAASAGAAYLPESGCIDTVYMGRPYRMDCSNGQGEPIGHDRPLTGMQHVIVLHNLICAINRPLTGRLVSYREFPHGAGYYYDTFKRRSIDILMRNFGLEPQKLLNAVSRVPCEKADVAEVSVKIQMLPRVPVIYAVWGGDEEMAPSATILFDYSAPSYLPIEDLAVMASFGVYALIDICQ